LRAFRASPEDRMKIYESLFRRHSDGREGTADPLSTTPVASVFALRGSVKADR
jgi:hypothetical protein